MSQGRGLATDTANIQRPMSRTLPRRDAMALATLGAAGAACSGPEWPGERDADSAFARRPVPVNVERRRGDSAATGPALELTHFAPSLQGHTSWVHAVAWSPDGRALATAGLDGAVKVWDPASGRERFTLAGNGRSALAVAWSPDGALLAGGDEGSSVRLWRAADGAPVAAVDWFEHSVAALVFTPDGRRLATGSHDGRAALWDVRALTVGAAAPVGAAATPALTGVEPAAVLTRQPAGITSLAVSPDGRVLVAGAGDGGLVPWDLATGVELQTFPRRGDPVNAVAFSPDGMAVAAALMSRSGHVVVWDVATRTLRATLADDGGPAYAVAFSPDGRLLAVSSPDRTVALRDAASLRLVRTLPGGSVGMHGIAFSPDGTLLAAPAGSHSAAVWDVASGRLVRRCAGHFSGIQTLAFSPDGGTVAGGTRDSRILLWSTAGGRLAPRRELRGHGAAAGDALTLSGVIGVAFLRGGELLASGGADGTVRLWDLPGGGGAEGERAPRQRRVLTAHARWIGASPVNALSVSATRGLVGSATADGVARVWEADTGRRLADVRSERYIDSPVGFASLALAPDGTTLVTSGGLSPLGPGSRPRTRVWRVDGGQFVGPIGDAGTVGVLVFSPDGLTVACAQDSGSVERVGKLGLWELATGRRLASYLGHTAGIFALAFSPDGRRLASVAGDGSVRLWDARAGVELARATASETLGARCLAFSPDGTVLAAGRQDGALLVWSVVE